MIIIGRIRTDDIKKTTFELIGQFPDRFTNDYENNKKVLDELKIISEKKLRNRIAGYIARSVAVNTKRTVS